MILATFGVYTSILACAGAETITIRETIMAIADLKNVLKIFGGSELSEGEHDELRKEVLLMTLARAADADINIQTVEVDRIREILKETTGEDFTAADIRVAARAELYAEANLRKYLGSVNKKMRDQDRADTVQALADVFRSDRMSACWKSISSIVRSRRCKPRQPRLRAWSPATSTNPVFAWSAAAIMRQHRCW